MRGGYRPGSGRPKGSKNRRTMMLEEGAKVAAETGLAPLAYLLAIMRDEAQPQETRMEAAKAALPYCHPRLAAVHMTDGGEAVPHHVWLRRLMEEDEEAA